MSLAQRLLREMGAMLSPRVCHVCGTSLTKSEEVMCLGCLIGLPRTGVHMQPFNEIHRRLGHQTAVDRAAGWFMYKKGTGYADLLVKAKYADLPGIDRRLGEICATELAADHFFDGIDALVPMPMHWWKRWRRGYNQTEEICKGITKVTGIPAIGAIKAVRAHGVQSRHGRAQRHASLKGTLATTPVSAEIQGRHVLLVDDIITSGASCIEALRALSEASPATISVLALGLTSENV